MKVGIPKEQFPGEKRVAVTPGTAAKIKKLGVELFVETGAGEAAHFLDAAYAEAGVHVIPDVWSECDVILKVRAPIMVGNQHEVDKMKEGALLISFIWPAHNRELLERLQAKKATVLA